MTTTLAGGPIAIEVQISDADVRRIAQAVAGQVAALVPDWLPDRPLDRAEAAAFLGVSQSTLRRWEDDGILVPAVAGQWVRYAPPVLAAFLMSGADR